LMGRLALAIYPVAWIATRVSYRDDLYNRRLVVIED
jgi:hypothetical protein